MLPGLTTLPVRTPLPLLNAMSRAAALDPSELPFESVASLQPLIDYWKTSAWGQGYGACLQPALSALLDAHPELSAPIDDLRRLRDHREALDLLFLPLFPPAFREVDLGAALAPFGFQILYATPPFARFFDPESGTLGGNVALDVPTYTYAKILTAYLHVLRTHYGGAPALSYPVPFTLRDPQTGLDRHFALSTDLRYTRVAVRDQLPPLSPAERRTLLAHVFDLEAWRTLLPPEHFRFEGFSLARVQDVTDAQVLDRLERDLLAREQVLSGALLPALTERVRTLLQVPGLKLGLAALDEGALHLLGEPGQAAARGTAFELAELEGSLFARALEEQAIQLLPDLALHPAPTGLEADMMAAGVRTLVVAPLFEARAPVGVLYLWMQRPEGLSAAHLMRLTDVLPLFAVAVRQGLEAQRNRVQSVIMGEYTSIHPTVEWRFREAAVNYLRQQEQGRGGGVEPIVFHEVVPLYGAADIRGSSTHRNEALQRDLLEHLLLADQVLSKARTARPQPMLYHLRARTARYVHALQDGLSSGDEAAVQHFLEDDVEPVLETLRRLGAPVAEEVDRYWQAVNSTDGALYQRCRAFEASVTTLNDAIVTFLDEEQRRLQPLYPHYFERHQTDGVDFNVYVGASLLEEPDTFDPLSITLLRLWQLTALCGIAQRVTPLQRRLPTPLDMTYHVLVQQTPLSIRYRFDETRFDVAGTQHIRYEIMKQRVEKACVRGTDERLTQPGLLTVVYAYDREGEAYRAYLRHLHEAGFVEEAVASLAVDDLQGIKGLRALRVPIRTGEVVEATPSDLEEAARRLPALND